MRSSAPHGEMPGLIAMDASASPMCQIGNRDMQVGQQLTPSCRGAKGASLTFAACVVIAAFEAEKRWQFSQAYGPDSTIVP